MKTKLFFIAFAAVGLFISSCEKEKVSTDKISFEEIDLGSSGYYNGSDLAGSFTSGNGIFRNYYTPDPDYPSWSGFSCSNHTDTETRGYTNQYSSIAGSGASGSSNYAVLYSYSSDTIEFIIPEKVTSISFCNSTYAYYSMLEGDGYAKQFGGDSGDDLDYFNLNINCLDENYNSIGGGTITLADYRYTNNAEDYIANIWSEIDLSEIGYMKYMVFSFESSDVNDWGIKTPTYICIDNIIGELQE